MKRLKSLLKFIYSEKATKFCKISTLLLSYVVPVKVRWRFRKMLWPSQNIRTLKSKMETRIRKVVIPIVQHAALLLYSAWKSYTSLAYFLKPYMHMVVKNKYSSSDQRFKIPSIISHCFSYLYFHQHFLYFSKVANC